MKRKNDVKIYFRNYNISSYTNTLFNIIRRSRKKRGLDYINKLSNLEIY